jgi:hypothetical protein
MTKLLCLRLFMICTYFQMFSSGDKIKEVEMDEEYGLYEA